MQYIQGISRQQLQMSSLEDTISTDNPIRFFEAFVNHIDFEKLGFQPKVLKSEGRPSTHNGFNGFRVVSPQLKRMDGRPLLNRMLTQSQTNFGQIKL